MENDNPSTEQLTLEELQEHVRIYSERTDQLNKEIAELKETNELLKKNASAELTKHWSAIQHLAKALDSIPDWVDNGKVVGNYGNAKTAFANFNHHIGAIGKIFADIPKQ